MKALEICTHLGTAYVDGFYNELSSKEVRQVLKGGGASTNAPETAFTRAARLKAWRKRFDGEFAQGNEKLALALLLEWLMGHHRDMLVDFLEFLKVPHQQGQTDEDFCETRTPEQLREGADMLLGKYPAHHVATYLLLVGHLQETPVFDQTPSVLTALGLKADAAAAYVETHKQTWKPSNRGAA